MPFMPTHIHSIMLLVTPRPYELADCKNNYNRAWNIVWLSLSGHTAPGGEGFFKGPIRVQRAQINPFFLLLTI